MSGSVNAVKESSEGRSLTIATFEPRDIFWGLAFFYEDTPMPVTLEATKETRIVLWCRERILPVIYQNGRFSWELSRLMVKRMLRASAIVDELAFQPVTGRVARMLLEQFPASQNVVPRHLTLDEMASHVGTTREMVCRILYRFAEAGAIQINRTEFVFTDRGILDEFLRRTG
jgi:CRP-like cAMP-binding protein